MRKKRDLRGILQGKPAKPPITVDMEAVRKAFGGHEVAPIFLKEGEKEAPSPRPALDPETAEKCKALITGAVQLMTRRLNGQVEPPLSRKQYDMWLKRVEKWNREVVSGQKTFEQLYALIEISINVPYVPDDVGGEERKEGESDVGQGEQGKNE